MILLTPLIMNGRPMSKRPTKGRYRVALITFAPAFQCTWAEGPEWLGPLARTNRGQGSVIDHVHGDFHTEAKLGGLRSLPSPTSGSASQASPFVGIDRQGLPSVQSMASSTPC